MADYIWGRYPVLEALRSRRRVHRILVAQGPQDAALTQVVDQARRVGVAIEPRPRRDLDQIARGANHQGVVALAAPRTYAELDDIFARAEALGEPPLIVVLDAIQDVQNLGSLIRTAEAVGAHGVVIPEHRAAGLTPAVDKTSAGAVELLPVARVTNISKVLDDLKKRGLWCIGLDGDAETDFYRANLTGPIALVVGNEGKGLSRLVREHCDTLVRIPMRGRVRSLNAAVAGSIALYEIWRQREGMVESPETGSAGAARRAGARNTPGRSDTHGPTADGS
jgi:23S rRNA (guanosine2251-2'-O)-methyltransferase